jgi:hypothetical protein
MRGLRTAAMAVLFMMAATALWPPVVAAAPADPWTVMVYIDADNNLEEYGVIKLHQHLVLDDDWHIMLP